VKQSSSLAFFHHIIDTTLTGIRYFFDQPSARETFLAAAACVVTRPISTARSVADTQRLIPRLIQRHARSLR
jgi:hypothetical protein